MKKLILRSFQSPGDILMLTAAVRDLHAASPGQFQTDIRTSADGLWLNNPHVTRLNETESGVKSIDMHYPLIHQSNERPYHFIHGYVQYLEDQLKLKIPVTRFQGDVHLSNQEKTAPFQGIEQGLPGSFWIVIAGGKYDFTAKWWNPANYQKVVDHFHGRIQFVQCGEQGHWHPKLSGVIDLVGKTSLRDFVRLMYHADGALCPVTFAMHLAAAVETRPGKPRRRPCVVVAGGREPPHWEAYPHHQFLTTVGALSCCMDGGCWKSRCQLVGDGDQKDRRDVCEQPVQVTPDLRLPRCMEMITAEDVIRRIDLYLQGASARTDEHTNGALRKKPMTTATVSAPTQPTPAAPATDQATNVLIKFRHGLGDAVQLTTVIQHLKHYHPDWNIDVAALIGKHSTFQGLCRRVYMLDREEITDAYGRVLELDWSECYSAFGDSPSTKAERCLREVFRLTPLRQFCTYKIQRGQKALTLARNYLEQICEGKPPSGERFPAVLIHYEGNTSADRKNLTSEMARELCDIILDANFVPVILDWDYRSKLPDGQRIHNPNLQNPLWGRTGTGDAEALAALIELSSLMIGVDSGPLHVAGATSTPTLGVWTRHHPLHYFGLADNVTHVVPETHASLIRGDRAVGEKYFNENYRHRTYQNLGQTLAIAVQEQLKAPGDGLKYQRNFWIRQNNVEQDLVVVQDIAEEDSYGIDDLPMVRPVVVDIGAHIGCFASRFHRRNPLAHIVAIECCPENIAALQKNVGGFATVIQAAVTYEKDVALLNAVFPDCVTTGGSTIIDRQKLEQKLAAKQLHANDNGSIHEQYWVDLRPVRTMTLEDVLEQSGFDHIDVLKLDCEGSEFSILGNTQLLDRIGIILGEYHGKELFLKLVRDRFADWKLRILKDGELGVFWLSNPKQPPASPTTPAKQTSVTKARTLPTMLVAAMRNQPNVCYDVLLLENGLIAGRYEHQPAHLRGFARLDGELWTIDAVGGLYRIHLKGPKIELEKVSTSLLAFEAHDLTVVNGMLATASPRHNAIAIYDTKRNDWSLRRLWLPEGYLPEDQPPPYEWNRHHLNSLVHDGESFVISFFSSVPKKLGRRWRNTKLNDGTITRWGPNGFADRPIATGMYCPHSLRLHRSRVWWCNSFRAMLCRDDGWRSPELGGFARGLAFADGQCIVGLSKSRVNAHPEMEICGLCLFDPEHPEQRKIVELGSPYIEIYDVIALDMA